MDDDIKHLEVMIKWLEELLIRQVDDSDYDTCGYLSLAIERLIDTKNSLKKKAGVSHQ